MLAHQHSPIMVFLPSLGGGGAERAMILFCAQMAKWGFSVILVCVSAEGQMRHLVPPEVELVDLKASRMSHAILKLRALVIKTKPRAVYSTIVHANLATIIATAGMTIPVVIRESNAPLAERKASISRKINHFLAKYLYSRASAIICVSQHVASEITAMCRGVANKIHALPTPVIEESLFRDSEQPLPQAMRAFFEEAPTIVAVARLHPQKNLSLLIDAVAEVNKTTSVQLAILGEGPLRSTLSDQIATLQLGDRVRLLGFQSNPFNYIRSGRMLVLSSDYEGMPNVLIQALALGVPVVSTDCPGGSKELLRGGIWGNLTPVGQVQPLAAAIKNTLLEPKVVYVGEVVANYGVDTATRAYLNVIGVASDAS